MRVFQAHQVKYYNQMNLYVVARHVVRLSSLANYVFVQTWVAWFRFSEKKLVVEIVPS